MFKRSALVVAAVAVIAGGIALAVSQQNNAPLKMECTVNKRNITIEWDGKQLRWLSEIVKVTDRKPGNVFYMEYFDKGWKVNGIVEFDDEKASLTEPFTVEYTLCHKLIGGVVDGSSSTRDSSKVASSTLANPETPEASTPQEANAPTTDSASNVQKLSVKSVPTPYGTVSIDADNRLLLNGELISADIEANNSLDIEASVSLGTDSVVLITNYGGSACRALYRWVSFGKSGITVTDEFGTCSDLAQPTLDGNKLVIRLPREREDTTLEHVKYEFDGKELTESVEK